MAQNLGRTRAMTVRVLVVDDEPDDGSADTVATALERGAVEFITKPVDFPKLRQDIMAVMTDATGGNG
jgi:DNA-binding response OmpR family regulator